MIEKLRFEVGTLNSWKNGKLCQTAVVAGEGQLQILIEKLFSCRYQSCINIDFYTSMIEKKGYLMLCVEKVLKIIKYNNSKSYY